MNDPRHADTRTTCGPQLRAAVRSTSDKRIYAALVVALMDSNDVLDFPVMTDMLGLTHAELAERLSKAQEFIENEVPA